MMSSVKPEVHNILPHRQRRIKPRPQQATKVWRSSAVWFFSYASGQTHKRTKRHAHHTTLHRSRGEITRNTCSRVDVQSPAHFTHDRATLTFDLLTSFSQHGQRLPRTTVHACQTWCRWPKPFFNVTFHPEAPKLKYGNKKYPVTVRLSKTVSSLAGVPDRVPAKRRWLARSKHRNTQTSKDNKRTDDRHRQFQWKLAITYTTSSSHSATIVSQPVALSVASLTCSISLI